MKAMLTELGSPLELLTYQNGWKNIAHKIRELRGTETWNSEFSNQKYK